jgi:hypothetical protein
MGVLRPNHHARTGLNRDSDFSHGLLTTSRKAGKRQQTATVSQGERGVFCAGWPLFRHQVAIASRREHVS